MSDLLTAAYGGFVDVLRDVDDDTSWHATDCLGWAVRDLTYHCVSDLQRGLVALHTPTDEAPTTDAVGYWAAWGSDPAGDADGRRHARVVAGLFGVWDQLRSLHAETAAALVDAAGRVDPAQAVRTQGHVLRADDLISTLAVEATIHHLDLVADLPGLPGPSDRGLQEVRRVLDGLLGSEAAPSWTTERYVRVLTGRATPTDDERSTLGPLVDRLPVFT